MKHLQSINELFGFGKKKKQDEEDPIKASIKKTLEERFTDRLRGSYVSGQNTFDEDGVRRLRVSATIKLNMPRSSMGTWTYSFEFDIKEFDDVDYVTVQCVDSYLGNWDDNKKREKGPIVKKNNIQDAVKYACSVIRERTKEYELLKAEEELVKMKEKPNSRRFDIDASNQLDSHEDEFEAPKVIEPTKVEDKPKLSNLKKFLD